MSTHIYWILEVAIKPGKLADFRAVANDLIAVTKSEPGTLAYEWNLSHGDGVCHIYERYQDSEAMIKHVQSFGNFAARFMEACRPLRFDVYGTPSKEAKAALSDLNPTYFNFLGGFHR